MKMSTNFSLAEMTSSHTAQRLGIDNSPNDEQIENLKELCEKVLQPIRDKFGPVRITSGLRVPDLNTAIGGSKSSQHCKGEASDINLCANGCGGKNAEVFDYIKSHLVFDQLIWEFGESCPAWVHVSYTYGKNRGEVLTASKKNGRTVYTKLS
tara:strand:+ start:750 stop:1208 length:459 start_codon:yes stop_codon:yes gene_type:complete